MKRFIHLLLILSFIVSPALFAAEDAAQPPRTAFDVYQQLQQSSLYKEEIPIPAAGYEGSTDMVASFGAEKEGSSSIITRVMGPSAEHFNQMVNALPPEEKAKFQRDFLKGWVSGTYRQKKVVDKDGVNKMFDFADLRKNYDALTPEELNGEFGTWLARTEGRPYSFINSATRRKLFNGEMPGGRALKPGHGHVGYSYYAANVVNFGEAEKYIRDAHATSVGWEINFVPQQTYGAQDKMVSWFRKELGVNGQLFEAPGHQWNVFPFPKDTLEDAAKSAQYKKGLGEVLRGMQTFIVLKGLGGRSGMEFSNYKTVHTDDNFTRNPLSIGRGVVRAEQKGMFGEKRFGIELRAGTKNDSTRRALQQALTARAITGDFSGLAEVGSYKLHPDERELANPKTYMERFGVSKETAEQFLEKAKVSKMARGSARNLSKQYLLPLWQWENAPYLSPTKKGQIQALSKSFIESIARSENLTSQKVQNMLQDWVKASNLEDEVLSYLQPKATAKSTEELMRFPVKPGAVDVNAVDLGLEYTGRFPTKPRSVMSDQPLPNGRRGWLAPLYDMTPQERLGVMKETAEDIAKTFGAAPNSVTSEVGGHGHALGAAFFARDPQTNGKWRVEWDGVTREYDLEGKVIPESVRGGHVEVVTPKTKLTGRDVDTVFDVFERQGLKPDAVSGGGHINFDLAPFDGKPQKFAKLLARFLENRGTIAMMFQHVDRLKSAEPLDVPPGLIEKLKNFNGSEDDLKKMLYNERWFNQRVGRKSRYTQIDIASYFQDVIPEKFVNKDFDLFNDMWRQNFRVEPKIRKAEFRLFNAPRDAREAALQTKLVRAMLNDALNESSTVQGKVQPVDFEKMVKNPKAAEAEFNKTMQRLKLDPKEYKSYFLDGMEMARERIESSTYVPLAKRLEAHPKVGEWGQAVPARPAAAALSSEVRAWNGQDVHPAAKRFYDQRMATRQRRAQLEQWAQAAKNGRLQRDIASELPVDTWKTLPEEAVLPFLHAQQNAPRTEVRAQAQAALAELRGKAEFPNMLAKGLDDAASGPYAQFVVREVMTAPEPPTTGMLMKIATSENANVRAATPELLKRFSPEQAREALLTGLVDSLGSEGFAESNKVGHWNSAFRSLMPNPLPEGAVDPRPEFVERAMLAAPEEGRANFIKYLAGLMGNYSESPAVKKQLADMFLRYLDEPSVGNSVQSAAARALFYNASDMIPEEKLKALIKHPNEEIAKEARVAYQSVLATRLGDQSRDVRLAAITSLRELPQELRFGALANATMASYTEPEKLKDFFLEMRKLDLAQILIDDRNKYNLNQMFRYMTYDIKRIYEPSNMAQLLNKLRESPAGVETIDQYFRDALANGREGAPTWIKWARQNVKEPSPAMVAALQDAILQPALRDAAMGAMMQWKRGVEGIVDMAAYSEPARNLISREACQLHFQRMGVAVPARATTPPPAGAPRF